MDVATKKAWNRPELIVIVRGGREENAVLVTCKSGTSSSMNGSYVSCGGPGPSECSECYTRLGR